MRVSNKIWAIIPPAAALNIVCGWLAAAFKLPLYLDSIGTILAGSLGGPAAGLLTALVSSCASILISSPVWAFFMPTALILGWSSGILARQGLMKTKASAAAAGLLLGVIGAVCSAPIASEMLQGSTGGGSDLVVAAFRAAGLSRMQACFVQSMTADPFDKSLSCLIVHFILSMLPLSLIANLASEGMEKNLPAASKNTLEFYAQSRDEKAVINLSEADLGRTLYVKADSFLHKTAFNNKFLLVLISAAAALRFPSALLEYFSGSPINQESLDQYILFYIPILMAMLFILSITGKTAAKLISIMAASVLPLSLSMIIFNALLSAADTQIFIPFADISAGISVSAAKAACFNALKISLIFEALLLLLLTSSPKDIMQFMESCGMPPNLSYSVLAAIYLIPQMIGTYREILEAQISRGMPYKKDFINRIKIWTAVSAPLIISIIWESSQRTMALEARGFGSKIKKKQHRSSALKSDPYIFCLLLLILSAQILLPFIHYILK